MVMFGRGDLFAKPQWLGPRRTSDKTQPLLSCQPLRDWNQEIESVLIQLGARIEKS